MGPRRRSFQIFEGPNQGRPMTIGRPWRHLPAVVKTRTALLAGGKARPGAAW